MNIAFPINIILRKGLTADDYTICLLLLEKKYGLLKEMYKIIGNNFYERIKILIENEYLHFYGIGNIMPLKEIIVTEKFKNILKNTDLFEELYNKFPVKVTRPEGKEDYLRTDKNKCRIKYNKLTNKNALLHDHMIQCLEYEVDLRSKLGTMGYFKQMRNWLDSEEWKKYEEKLNINMEETVQDNSETKSIYGTNIL